jgi:hypothetical protein
MIAVIGAFDIALEDGGQMPNKTLENVVERRSCAEQLGEAGNALVGDATWDDETERRKVVGYIQSESVRRHPTRDAYADGAELGVSQPYARMLRDALSGDSEVGACSDHDLLEIANVTMDVAAVGGEVENRIDDGLPGAMKRDVAAASALENVDALGAEGVDGKQQMLSSSIATQGDDGRMLHEQHSVGDQPLLALRHEPLLKLQGLGVGEQAVSSDQKLAPVDHVAPDIKQEGLSAGAVARKTRTTLTSRTRRILGSVA